MLRNALNRPVIRDTFYVLLVQICSKGTLHVVLIFMAQYLSIQDFARYGFFLVTAAVLAGYLGLGLPLAASKAIAAGQPGPKLNDHISAIVLLGAVATLAAVTTAPLYQPLLIPASLDLGGGWVVGGAIAGAWAALAQAALYSVHGFDRAVGPVLFGSLVLGLGAVIAGATGHVTPLLMGAIGSSVVGFVGTILALRGRGLVPDRVRLPSRRGLRTVLATAVPGMGIAAIFVTFNWLISRSLVDHQSAAGQFNIFSIGLQWFSLVLFVPLALGQAIFPRYVRMAGAEEIPLWVVLRPVAFTSAVLFAAAPVAAMATPLLVWFYGGHYDFSPYFVGAVFLAAALAGVQNLVGNYVIAVKGAVTWLVANLVALTVCIILVLLAPPSTASHAMLELVACYGCLASIALLCVGASAVATRRRRVASFQGPQ